MAKTSFQYGGQAVIEGVMMRGPKRYAVAVRKPGGDIVLDEKPISSLMERFAFLKWPFIRGFIALLESLLIGIKTLTYSANQAGEEEEEELTRWEMVVTISMAVGLAVLLFIVLPTGAAHYLENWFTPFWQNFMEGLIRIAVFIIYVVAISQMKDIQRVFQYHGAEHKVIHTYEAGKELTAENAGKFSAMHPRCGTSFLLLVLILTVIVYSFLHTPQLWWRILSRVLLLPVIAGIGYEILKFSGKHAAHPLMRILIAPGLWLQKLTTREPEESQLEVAIKALEAVLEGKQTADLTLACQNLSPTDMKE